MTTVELNNFRLTLGKPVRIIEAVGHSWFPVVHRFPSGELIAQWSMMPDIHAFAYVTGVSHSTDNGKTWGPPYAMGQWSNLCVPLAGVPGAEGALRKVPYYIYPEPASQKQDFVTDLYTVYPGGRYEVRPRAVRVGRFPKPVRISATGAALLNFNGTCVIRDGRWLMTLYGAWDDAPGFLSNVYLFESRDQGLSWSYVTTIARHEDVGDRAADDDARGGWQFEGPDEASLCELEGGELLCIYRVGSGGKWPYRHSRSTDGGATWSKPAILNPSMGSVEPSLQRLRNGALALSGGRPNLHLWLNADPRGLGDAWEHVDISAHHNDTCEERERMTADGGQTSAYTELCEYAPNRLVMIYDRVPLGWKDVPADSPERAMVFVVHVDVERR